MSEPERVAREIRVQLPAHLRTLAGMGGGYEILLEVACDGGVTPRAILEALEARYPMLRGTIREHGTLARRPFLRFFACGTDLSHLPMETPVPEGVASGREAFVILGAIAGG